MLKWSAVYDEVKKFTAPEGFEFIELGRAQLYPVDQALRNGNVTGAFKLASKCLPYLYQLLPHVHNEKMQIHLQKTAYRIEQFIENTERNGLTLGAVHSFLELESLNLGNILGALLGAVVDLVGDVGEMVGDVVGDVLDSLL